MRADKLFVWLFAVQGYELLEVTADIAFQVKEFKMKNWHSFAITMFVVVALTLMAENPLQGQDVPEGFQQLLPRGGIPAIDNPQYVSADKAEITDGAYVFGVVIEEQPVAYSLNLLNSHEVVNDTVGNTNFAAVW